MEVARRELDIVNEDDERRLYVKTELVRYLFQLGISRKKIQHLLDFIKYYIHFEKEGFFDKFDKDIEPITKSRKAMGIREAILEEFKEKGLREGRKEGRKEGLEQGLEKGREEGIRLVISRAYKRGMPVEEIADLVGFSKEKVESIILEWKKEEEQD